MNLIRPLLFVLLLAPGFNWAAQTYENDEARFKITFPTHFEVEQSQDEESKAYTITCLYQGMIFVVNAIIFDKEFSEDESFEQEVLSCKNMCKSMGAKWKPKKLTAWRVEDNSGFILPIKGKKKSNESSLTFYGNYYVMIVGKIQYQLTVLAQKRKYFNGNTERAFSNSFRLLF
ncbi:MAG: hypothetical protein MI810_05005 [Flavobacteriales bacterium]|nr:hypothetical protein [Flavobacteriales bacterium]